MTAISETYHYMFRIRRFLPPLPIVAALAFVGGILLLVGQMGQPCPKSALYAAGKLCVTEEVHSSYEQRNAGGGGESQYSDIVISDGSAAPVRITYDVPNEGLASVQMVSPNAVNVVFGSNARRFVYFWEYDRRTRQVLRFTPASGRLVTLLPNGDEVLIMDDEGLYVADTYLRERARFAFHPENEYLVASAPSSDGAYVALLTWNAQYEEPDAKWRVYALDLRKGTVVFLGDAPFAEQLVWKGKRSVVTTTGCITDGANGCREEKMFTVDE